MQGGELHWDFAYFLKPGQVSRKLSFHFILLFMIEVILFKISFCFVLNLSEGNSQGSFWVREPHGFSTCAGKGRIQTSILVGLSAVERQTPSLVEDGKRVMGRFFSSDDFILWSRVDTTEHYSSPIPLPLPPVSPFPSIIPSSFPLSSSTLVQRNSSKLRSSHCWVTSLWLLEVPQSVMVPRTDWLNQWKFISSWFWRLEVQDLDASRMVFFWGCSWLLGGRLLPLSSRGLSLCFCSFLVFPPPLKRTSILSD